MGRRFAGFRVKQTYFRAFLTEPGVDGASRFFFCTDRPLAFAFAFAFPFGEALGFRLGFPLGLAESLVSDGAWHLDPRNRPKKQNIVLLWSEVSQALASRDRAEAEHQPPSAQEVSA